MPGAGSDASWPAVTLGRGSSPCQGRRPRRAGKDPAVEELAGGADGAGALERAVGGEVEEDLRRAARVLDQEAAVRRQRAPAPAAGLPRCRQAVATVTAASTPIEAWTRCGMKLRVAIAPPARGGGDQHHLRHRLRRDVAEVHQRAGLQADRLDPGLQRGIGLERLAGLVAGGADVGGARGRRRACRCRSACRRRRRSRRRRCRSAAARRSHRAGDVLEHQRDGGGGAGHAVDGGGRRRRSPGRPASRPCAVATSPVLTMWMRDRGRRRPRRHQAALDGGGADAGEDVAAGLGVGDDRPGRRRPAGRDSRRRRPARVDGASDRDLGGQRVGAADAVDLPRVGRAHDRGAGARRARPGRRAGRPRGSRRPSTCRRASRGRGCRRSPGQTYFRPFSARRGAHVVDVEAELARGEALRASPPRRRVRFSAAASTSAASARFTTHDAVVVGDDRRRRARSRAPAQTIGTLTEPSVSLTVPCAETAFDQTGKPISRQVAHVAHAGVDDQPAAAARHRRGGEQVAEVAVVAGAGRREDEDVARSRSCSIATWIIQLSPGGAEMVTAEPAMRAPA